MKEKASSNDQEIVYEEIHPTAEQREEQGGADPILLERELMALEEAEYTAHQEYQSIKFKVSQKKRELSIANKEYWKRVKG